MTPPRSRHAMHARQPPQVVFFRKAGKAAGARRAVPEIVKWLNHVTDNRVLTLTADLSESVNLEHGSIWGHHDPEANPRGTRLKAAIQEAGNASNAIGLVGQNASLDPEKFAGVPAEIAVAEIRHDVYAAGTTEKCEREQGIPSPSGFAHRIDSPCAVAQPDKRQPHQMHRICKTALHGLETLAQRDEGVLFL